MRKYLPTLAVGEADVRMVYDITTIKELEGEGEGTVLPGLRTRDLRTSLARWSNV